MQFGCSMDYMSLTEHVTRLLLVLPALRCKVFNFERSL